MRLILDAIAWGSNFGYIIGACVITEGIAGARRASAKTKLYVRPRVVLPKTDTMAKAMRLPRPDLMNPPESQKAIAISHLQRQSRFKVCVVQAAEP